MRLLLARSAVLGIGPARALLWELPKLAAWRAYQRAVAELYRLAGARRIADGRARDLLRAVPACGRPRVYVIVVPDVLHLLWPALRLIEPHVGLVLVLNGVSGIETATLSRAFPAVPRLRVPTLPWAPWPHGHLLSLLLRTSPRDFGIIDHDFFVLDPVLLESLRPRDNEYAVAATAWHNEGSGLAFPGTHLLYLRVAVLRKIMDRYGVDARLYRRIPARVRAELASLGLDRRNPPKDYQSFFDSFTMLSAMAIRDGYVMRILRGGPGAWVHIGGTSLGRPISKDVMHHYITSRFLAALDQPAIIGAYRRRGLARPEQCAILRRRLSTAEADAVDRLIDRILSAAARCGPARRPTTGE